MSTDDALVERASRYAIAAHSAINQRRKYSGAPYHEHLARVAAHVAQFTPDAEAIAAAWLHDVVEDTPSTIEDVERDFGARVAQLVLTLTDATGEHGNRAQRKAVDRARIAQGSDAAKTVKLADMIDNAEDIANNDPQFARIYLREMAALLDVINGGDQDLFSEARELNLRLMKSLNIKPIVR